MATAVTFGRPTNPATRKLRQMAWILCILLAAAALRLVNLSDIPPGMTHDEADHGLTAWQIVEGTREIYFTVGYGREPLYDYATALLMAGTGPTIFAARLTSVYFSLLLLAATYAWALRAFGRPAALLAAAGLASGFWPLMAARQALRSIALPAMFALAALFYWRVLQGSKRGWETGRLGDSSFLPFPPAPLLLFALSGLLLGLTFYTYIPARVMWLAFPLLAVYFALAAPPGERRAGRTAAGAMLTLVTAAVVAAPLFIHLANNPGLEVRIDELSAPLRAARGGDFAPLWANARGALRLFTVEGDQTWRYNIPGKPFLGPVMGALFYGGLLLAGWLAARGLRRRGSLPFGFGEHAGAGAFFALVWLGLGFAAVLVTGPGLSMTQAIGILPVLYLFPALALAAAYHVFATTRARRTAAAVVALATVLFVALGGLAARDYFGRWANEPEVRVQYEATMVAALRYLDARGGAAAVSTITPGPFHTPAVALMTLRNPEARPRWFDARESLLFPAEGDSIMLLPGFTPVAGALQPFLAQSTATDELPMRPDDLDRPLRVLALASPPEGQTTPLPAPARFGDRVELLGYRAETAEARPGDTLRLITQWRLLGPLPDASLFAHLLGGDGRPAAVADSLGAPGDGWTAGDNLLQLHTIEVPAGTPPGDYALAVGVYTRDDGARLAIEQGGEPGDDMFILMMVRVLDE